MRSTKHIWGIIESSATLEEMNTEIRSGEFVAHHGKLYKMLFIASAVIAPLIGVPIFLMQDRVVGTMFLVLGALCALMTQFICSYRCSVNCMLIREEYFFLFIPFRKEVLWKNVEYMKHQKSEHGTSESITFYDTDKKKLFSFGRETVGFERIRKMAKSHGVKKIQ